jgi:hypothetical protein
MATSEVETIEPWTRPPKTTLIRDEDYADLTTLDLSKFDQPGGKEAYVSVMRASR